ncbi:hypothetical protein [Brevundimonas diminuta]
MLETDVEAAIPHHPMQEIFYGDAPRMADKPRIIRAKVIIDQVRARLAPHDDEQGVVSFVGFPQRVNDYLVAVVLRVRASCLTSTTSIVPSLRRRTQSTM